MKLFILFAHFPNKLPLALTAVDELTIKESGVREDEYKRLVLDKTQSKIEEKVDHWGWFEVRLPEDARNRIRQYLVSEAPTFTAVNVAPSPTQKIHPSYDGIKVTVGRTPGKIEDENNSFG